MKTSTFLALAGLAASASAAAATSSKETPTYKNPKAKTADRVADLLKRMTIDEKAAQLVQGDIRSWIDPDTGAFNKTGLEWSMKTRASQFYVYHDNWTAIAEGIRLAQDYLVNHTDLGIPAIAQTEGIHGFLVPNATIFNSPIAQGCSWNPGLVEKMAKVIAQEAAALGVNHLFAPLGDIIRDMRYGRNEESYTEDPYLTGEFAYSYVKGLQSGGVVATVKHFAGVSNPEQGVNTAPVHGGQRELLTTWLPSYKRAIIDAGAMSIMGAYHAYDGMPVVAHPGLLTDILRDSWGYEHFVISDAGATDRLCTAFMMCESDPIDAEAIVSMALTAGTDVEMGGGSYNYEKIPAMVRAGKLSEKVVDQAVSRLLRTKFDMGLFEKPFLGVSPDQFDKHIHTAEAIQLARELDAESIVLLENHNNVLPLKKDAKIAVLGPMAHGYMNYGDYVYYQSQYRGVTPYDGIKAASSGEVTYAKGCERWSNDESGFAEAVAAAEAADVAVVVVGTWSRDQAELWSGFNATTGEAHDTTSLDLVGAMPRLVKAIIATGKPTVVVFSSGKPVTEPWISDEAAALVQQFYPSEQGGAALADVLFGDVNPSGRLSVSVPTTIAATPINYDYLNSARAWPSPGHVYENGTLVFGTNYVLDTPLPHYDFGYGLSYSTFEYANLKLSKTKASAKDTITVTVDVTNNSTRDGQDVVQLYVKDLVASVVVPNKQLKGFSKVAVKAGETKKVSLSLSVQDLGVWNYKLQYVVEPGDFQLFIGASSGDLRLNSTLTVA